MPKGHAVLSFTHRLPSIGGSPGLVTGRNGGPHSEALRLDCKDLVKLVASVVRRVSFSKAGRFFSLMLGWTLGCYVGSYAASLVHLVIRFKTAQLCRGT